MHPFAMEHIMNQIEAHSVEYAKHPLWDHVQQHAGNAKDAMQFLHTFAPAVAHFMLGFKDANEFVIPYENPSNQLEIAINNHAQEDSSHYRLFLEDWQKLGGDALLERFTHVIPGLIGENHHELSETIDTSSKKLDVSTQIMSFLWSDECQHHCRKLLYKYAQLVFTKGSDPAARFAIVESGEETGLVMFKNTSALVKTIMRDLNVEEYRYFGDYHLNLETGHLVDENTMERDSVLKCDCEADEIFKTLQLTQEQYTLCEELVDTTFKLFTEWLDGILSTMQKAK